MRRKLIFYWILFFVFLISNVSAQISTGGSGNAISTGVGSAAFSNAQNFQPGFYSSSGLQEVIWPGISGNSQELMNSCENRQDFAVQIAPGGCSPMVVRSDLLAEQDVPVFCQLSALQINPTIKPENIKNIILTNVGNYSAGISGIAYYHPARIWVSAYKTSQGFPTYDNIGYAIIRLKRQYNESGLPDYVQGTLSAKIQYDIPYGFGSGMTEKIIPLMTDEEWQSRYPEFVFLNGNAFMRVEAIDSGKVLVAIYSDKDHIIDRFTIEKGKSIEKYLPGSSGYYCSLGYKATFTSAEVPKDKATIIYDNDKVDLYQGDSFADGLCTIGSIISNGGGTGIVSGNCKAYNGASSSFKLQLGSNNALFDFTNANKAGYAVGSLLYSGSEGENNANKNVYFAFQKVDPKNNINYAVLVALNQDEKFSDVSNKITNYVNTISDLKTKEDVVDSYPVAVIKQGEKIKFQGIDVAFSGFSSLTSQNTGDSEFEGYFSSGVDGFKSTDETYGERNFQDNGIGIATLIQYNTYGPASLFSAVDLASNVGKSAVMNELINLFKKKYANENLNLPENYAQVDFSNANTVIDLNGETHTISLVNIDKSSTEKNGVEIILDNSPRNVKQGDYILPVNFSGNEEKSSIKLTNFDDQKITASGNCYSANGFTTQTMEIYAGSEATICGHSVRVNQINVQLNAKIKLDPIINNAGSSVNVSYKIGIEKRAFPLSPEKTQERIDKLNQSIKKWEDISNNLKTVVSGMKAACFVTSATLQVKNLFSNLGGKAIARQEVMKGQGGWDAMCAAAMATSDKSPPSQYSNVMASGPYNSLDDCYGKNADAIDKDVNLVSNEISKVNSEVKLGQDQFTKDNVIDTNGARKAYIDKLKSELVTSTLSVKEDPLGSNSQTIKVGEVISKDLSDLSYDDARDIRLYTNILNSGDSSQNLKYEAQIKLYNILNNVNQQQLSVAQENSISDLAMKSGLFAGNPSVTVPNLERGQTAQQYYGLKLANDLSIGGIALTHGTSMQLIVYNGKQYYASLKQTGDGTGRYVIDKVFTVNNDGKIGSIADDTVTKELINKYPQFIEISSTSYNNQFKEEALVKYYETEPYKGVPAIVPFDTQKGWYAAVKQTLSVSSATSSVQDSGRVSSFWVCNIGKNGRVEFETGVGDDICEMVNTLTGQPTNVFNGMSNTDAQKLISNAQKAISDAQRQYSAGVKKVTILGKSIKVGSPMTSTPGTQCQDFMSPSDCKILFNVCDPVICPASRCNLGGKYYVSDVVQSGIAGSLALCLPNIKEGIVVPVCLTGVQAGVDNYVSILKASKDCLQENLKTGGYIGICDEITAIYTCEFFWKQAAPLMKVIIPKLLEFTAGGGARGGGEYMNVQEAWGNMQNSINYFTNVYGVNAITAFKVRSTEEAGTPICKAFVSMNFAKSFSTLIEPDSPTQFSAWFDEIEMTTATVPATSQYKVYYHIYSGNDTGVYYTVYLKDSTGESYYSPTESMIIATGYINRGEYVDQAIDKTAPAGFKQLCVRINTQESCGFKQVSTSFALNYIRDKYIEEEATNANIKTEKACISGSSNALSLVNPNLESGAQETLNPQIYERGIIRICATADPGETTEAGRWKDVGYCDDQKIRCWLDTSSIAGAITSGNAGVLNSTLSELNSQISNYINQQNANLMSDESEITSIERSILEMGNDGLNKDLTEMKNDKEVIFAKFDAIESKYILDDQQKARILFDKSYVFSLLAKQKWLDILKQKQTQTQTTVAGKTCDQLGGTLKDIPCNDNEDDITGSLVNVNEVQANDQYCCKAKSVSGVTESISADASTLVKLMNYAKTNSVGSRGCSCGDNCQAYANSIVQYSKSNNLDPILVLSLIMQESSCNSAASSSSGCKGLMQICSFDMCKDIGTQSVITSDTDKNIQCGIKILNDGYNNYKNGKQFICNGRTITYSGWDAALRAYNGWGCTTALDQDKFVEQVNERYAALSKIAKDNGYVSSTQTASSTQSNSGIKQCLNGEGFDLTAFTNYINANILQRTYYMVAGVPLGVCDVNGDGKYDVLDITAYRNLQAAQISSSDNLRQQIAKMIMTVPSDNAGTICSYAKDNQGNSIGGVILMGAQISTELQVKSLISDCKSKGVLIIATDGEGGKITRLQKIGIPLPSAKVLGSDNNYQGDNWKQVDNFASKMKSLGFNLNLAPDLDLTLSDTSNIGKSERSFGVSADNAKKKGQEFISKMHTAGIGATGKHFPGYGDVAGDSDNQLVKVEGINNNEKIIFNDLKNNLDAIMMSNIIYSADDPQNPAVFSNTIIEMAGEGFDNGVIITDDLNAKSVAPQQNCENAKVNAVKAFEAGNDMILNLNGKCVNDMVDAIYAAAQGDEDMKSQIAKSVDRINSLKDKYS